MATTDDIRLLCAARVAALVDAIRGIPPDLAPCRRAKTVAVREQIYYGWELPLSRAGGTGLIFGKYERDGWWSEAAALLVTTGEVKRGSRQLERDHVAPVGQIVEELLARQRTPEETAQLLHARLVTCTILAEEHRRLRPGEGWARYSEAGIAVRKGLPDP